MRRDYLHAVQVRVADWEQQAGDVDELEHGAVGHRVVPVIVLWRQVEDNGVKLGVLSELESLELLLG